MLHRLGPCRQRHSDLVLVMPLILSSLSLDQLLNLIALLKVVALGPMDLAVRPIALPGLLGSRSFPAIVSHGSLLAGDFSLGGLAGTRRGLSFNGHHCLILTPLIALLVPLLTGGFIIIL